MDTEQQQIDDPANGKLRYLRPFIVLVPALIVCIYNIKTNMIFMDAMLRLLFTIVFFYIVGTIMQSIIRRQMIQAEKDAHVDVEVHDEESDMEEEESETEEESLEE